MKINSLVPFAFIHLVQKWLSKSSLISCQPRTTDIHTDNHTVKIKYTQALVPPPRPRGWQGPRLSAAPTPCRRAELSLRTCIRKSGCLFSLLHLLLSTPNYCRTEGECWNFTSLMRCHCLVFTWLQWQLWRCLVSLFLTPLVIKWPLWSWV